MKVTVIGAGAVGGWFGGRLLATGHDVEFVARGRTREVLTRSGLVLNDADPLPVTVTDSPGGDVVFLAVKITSDTNIAELLAGVPDHAMIAVTQNSVETWMEVARVVGNERTWPGVVRGYFHHTGPGHVEYHGGPQQYVFGAVDGPAPPVAHEFTEMLAQAGFDSQVHPNILVELWEKAMFVGPTGALGAVSGTTLGHVRTVLRPSLAAMMGEVADVARASGVEVSTDAVPRTLAFADRMPETATSSMQRDLVGGAPHELDAQVGAIARLGRAHGVATPLHDLLLGLLS